MSIVNKIIINADDFGYSEAVNGAVLRCFQRFLVTSASMLVNFPGFKNAAELVQAHPILSDRIGVCLNLSEGFSLTSGIRSCASFCDEAGLFHLDGERRLLFLNAHERQAVYDELRAQLETALMAGIRPCHLDMHHSLHRQWAIAGLLARLGRDYGIPRMRFFRNMDGRGIRGYYRLLFNRLVWKYSGVCGPDLSGEVGDLLAMPEKKRPSGKFIEFIVRPAFDEYGELIDRDGKGLQLKLRPVLDHRHTISYAQLPVRPERRGIAGFLRSLLFQPLPERG